MRQDIINTIGFGIGALVGYFTRFATEPILSSCPKLDIDTGIENIVKRISAYSIWQGIRNDIYFKPFSVWTTGVKYYGGDLYLDITKYPTHYGIELGRTGWAEYHILFDNVEQVMLSAISSLPAKTEGPGYAYFTI